MSLEKAATVESTLGSMSIDAAGEPVAVVRLDPDRAYVGIPELLRSYINEGNPEAWETIKARIDYIYARLDDVIGSLNEEAGLAEPVKQQIKQGKRLLFKPNLVAPANIDPETHGEGTGHTVCTEWPFVAALMRWWHDKLDISYHEMVLGEAASATSGMAGYLSLHYNSGEPVTTEAVIEGRFGDVYAGWGFYFVRKYLADRHDAWHTDDPMSGYEESVRGEYLPPGVAGNRLMVYDLNRLYDGPKGRAVPVPQGANFREITLHKVVVGGDPNDPRDINEYPGCVLVNVPKLKMHAQDLLTNAVKNLGIGLYPQEAPQGDAAKTRWKYGSPDPVPGMKTELPHMPWIPQMDDDTGLPVRDEKGDYIVTKTAGMPGTQADVIRATQNQGVFMVHVVDAIEAINISHVGMGERVAEGLVMASLDPVALDMLCARYCLKTVPMREARRLQQEQGLPTDFMHRVPVARVEGQCIVTDEDVDSPLFRYGLYQYAEDRGVGRQAYYVVGWDAVAESPLASLQGHLGRVTGGAFEELMTSVLYFNLSCMLWDMQRTVLSYAAANDELTGSTVLKDIMDAYDENGDGVIDYNENGRKGHWTPLLRSGATAGYLRGVEQHGFLRGPFRSRSFGLRYGNRQWNAAGHDFVAEFRMVGVATRAFQMSRAETESPDPFFPSMTWGKGKWPSFQFASLAAVGTAIYGLGFPMQADAISLYGMAFQYADKTLNGSIYTGSDGNQPDPECVANYMKAVAGGASPLDFVLYVPKGAGKLNGTTPPNVEETEDPDRVFTASFRGGQEVWRA